jgi:hypothetical protein
MTWLLALIPGRVLAALTGIGAKAIALAVCATIIFGGIGYGLWWIRNDGYQDGRREIQAEMDRAAAIERAQASKKAREAAEVAAAERAALESELAVSHEAVERIGKVLALTPRKPVYPKAIIPELNR